MDDNRPTQAQTLATWRSLLGGAWALVRMGQTEAAVERIKDVQFQMMMAQIFGLPADEPAIETDE